MPISDRREIAFSATALVSVLAASQHAARAAGLPDRSASEAELDAGSQAVTLRYAGGEPAHVVPANQLAALLIAYCLRAGIKISRHLTRSVRIERDAIVLLFATDYDVSTLAPRPEDEGSARPARDPRSTMPPETRRGVNREWR